MADPCTYGGVPLFFPDADVLESAEEALNAWSRPEVSQWPRPPRLSMPRALEIGQLFWPWGAARCAVGLFLATDNQLARIRPQVYGPGGSQWNPLPFVMNDLRTGRNITTSLYMTPPRPLDQVPRLNGLYALTLVDDRYRWWEKTTTGITVTRNITTWTQLFQQFATVLGITLTPDVVNAAYLNPDATFATSNLDLPLLLDQAAASCGQRLVRLLNGAVITQNPRTAKKSQDAQLTAYTKDKGGLYFFTPPLPTDLQGQVPAQVVVTFPILRGGTFSQTVTLVSLGLPEYAGVPGHPNCSKVIRSLAGLGASNAAELTTLAKQVAQDWYLWQLGRQATRFFGIDPYTPEGINDHVKWTSRAGECTTWVRRARTPDLGAQASASSAGATIDTSGWWYVAPGTGGAPSLTGVLPIVDYGGLEVQGGLVTSALTPPTVTAITVTNPSNVTYTYTVIGTTVNNLTTAPGPPLLTPIGPSTPPTIANPITVSITTTPGITAYTIIQTTPNPGTVAIVTYDPTTTIATAVTPSGTTITGVTITPGPTTTIKVPIVVAPDQTKPLPLVIDTTSQVSTTTVLTTGIVLPQFPTPPPPTAVTAPPAGGTNVSYTVVLSTPALTMTPASSSLSLTSITTPSTTNPVSLQVDLTGIVPPALVPGAAVILYRPTNTGGLANGPIAVGTVVPGTNLVYLTDTGQGVLPNLPTTAPVMNTTGSLAVGGTVTGLNVVKQTNTATVTVTPIGTTGAANYTYKVTCTDQTGESVGTAGSTSTGNATLSTTNANVVTWTPSTSSPQSFKIYRTVGGASQGLIGTVLAGQPLVFVDTGIAAGAAAPATDTTGQLEINGVAVTTGGVQTLTFNVTSSQFTGLAGTSGTITLGTLPAGAGIPFRINHLTTKWVDGGADVVTATLSLLSGPSIDSGYVVSVTAPDWNFFNNITAIKAAGGTDSIRLNIATGGSLLSTLSAGALTVTIFYVQGS